MSASVMGGHTHVAMWRANAGASSDQRRVARHLVPWLQETKRAIVALGASYFSSDDVMFRLEAANLEQIAASAAAAVRECAREDDDDSVLLSLANEFNALQLLAHEFRDASGGPELMAQMRATYMQLRDLGSVLWAFEYQFEGNPRAQEDSRV